MVSGGSDIRVRLATEADADDLVDFGARLAFETEDKVLDKELVKTAVLRCIRNPKLGCYYVAWDDTDPEKKNIGTTMLTYEQNVALGGRINWI